MTYQIYACRFLARCSALLGVRIPAKTNHWLTKLIQGWYLSLHCLAVGLRARTRLLRIKTRWLSGKLGHDTSGLISQWDNTIKSSWACAVTSQSPPWYYHRCCQAVKPQYTNCNLPWWDRSCQTQHAHLKLLCFCPFLLFDRCVLFIGVDYPPPLVVIQVINPLFEILGNP